MHARLIYKLLLVFVLSLAQPCICGTPTYFLVNSPTRGTVWQAGTPNVVQWVTAVEGIKNFDIELARLSTDGIIFVAKNVPTNLGAVNLLLNSVPTGDDYFLIILDSTHGSVYSISSRFSILSSGAASNADPSKPTVTVVGGPNPTMQFAQTLAVVDPTATAGASRTISSLGYWSMWTLQVCMILVGVAGGTWAVW